MTNVFVERDDVANPTAHGASPCGLGRWTTALAQALAIAGLLALASAPAAAWAYPPPEAPEDPEAPEAPEAPEPAAAPEPQPDPFYAAMGAKLLVHTFDNGWRLAADAQYRPRYYAHSGRDFVIGGGGSRITQRARLGATMVHPDGWGMKVLLQDVRIWGEETSTINDFTAEGLDIQEAYVTIPVADILKLKVGRQEIRLDSERLVGGVAWAQRGRSFDAIRLSTAIGGLKLGAFYAKLSESNQDPDGSVPAGRTGEADFGGGHGRYELLPGHTFSFLYLALDDNAARVTRHTFGGTLTGKISDFAYTAEAFGQAGSFTPPAGSDPNTAIYTGMAAASVSYTHPNEYEPAVLLRAEILGGDGTFGGSFDTLFGTNHKVYGEMDFFLNIPVQTDFRGLIDAGGRVSVRPAKSVYLHADWHHFRAVQGRSEGNVFGNEIDFKLVYRPVQMVSLVALYGVLMPGEAFRAQSGLEAEQDLQVEHLGFITLDMSL